MLARARSGRIPLWTAVFFGFALAAGCSRQPAGGADASGERRFPLTGKVLAVDAAHSQLTVQHDAVAGLMPAMVMEFPVSAGDAAAAKPGERIRAELVLDAAGAARLEKIWPDDRVDNDAVAAGALQLRQDTHERGSGAYREIGENAPDFALYDQDGHVVRSGHFRGQQVMLNFIYTRCPIANMCPASTAKMMAAQRMAGEAGIKNIEFVSITLDPAYDTPGVLREYADARGINTGNFSFLTGPEGAIRDLLTQFGVIAEFQGGILKHTLATLLIDERGRIVWRADGSSWDPKEFVAKMRKS
jgi:protein SCO1/2